MEVNMITDEPILKYNAKATIEIEIEAEDMTDAEIKLKTIIRSGTEALSRPESVGSSRMRVEYTETKDFIF